MMPHSPKSKKLEEHLVNARAGIIRYLVKDGKLNTLTDALSEVCDALLLFEPDTCPDCGSPLTDTADVADLWDGALWCLPCGKMWKRVKDSDQPSPDKKATGEVMEDPK